MPRDLATPPPERFFLEGSSGRLAVTLERPAGEALATVLHLHPHPQHGGTRRNNVVRHGALGALEAGAVALRLDFRGAGESEGNFDNGRGEQEDGQVALDWLFQEFSGLPSFIWGFSFGAWVGHALAAAQADPCAGFLGVAWPSAFYAWPEDTWPHRASFLVAERDQFADLAALDEPRQRGCRIEIVPRADHFFTGHLAEVRDFTRRQVEPEPEELPV